MNYRIDNLQYCNWSRDIFKINRDAGLNAVHATVVYHEDYDEFLIKLKEWDNFCLLYTSPSPRDGLLSRMPSSA